ncbi:hypothetical protein ZWY2020_013600 [Hordeum vulgare]|nr:hypothetical protein ZWY2020_013600 [Hordeum vulgare]
MSNALSVCTAVGLFCLMGAYAAGSTQHLNTSIYIFALVVVVLFVAVVLLLICLLRGADKNGTIKLDEEQGKKAGLKPPGGAWQSTGNGYEAGNPVMHDNRRPRYLAFFYSNSISFMASIVVIIILPRQWLPSKEKGDWEKQSLRVMNWMIRLDLVALLMAYAAGSNRGWKTSIYVATLIVVVLGYFAIHMILSCICHRMKCKRRFAARRPKARLRRSYTM